MKFEWVLHIHLLMEFRKMFITENYQNMNLHHTHIMKFSDQLVTNLNTIYEDISLNCFHTYKIRVQMFCCNNGKIILRMLSFSVVLLFFTSLVKDSRKRADPVTLMVSAGSKVLVMYHFSHEGLYNHYVMM